MYRVKSIEAVGHWRSKRHWGNEWVEVEDKEITKLMRDDPRLRVEPVSDVPLPEDDPFSGPLPADEFVAEVEEPSAEVEPAAIEAEKPPLYVSDKELDGKGADPQRGKNYGKR